MSALNFGTAPLADDIRLTTIIPAGRWVGLTSFPDLHRCVITPLIAWALGECNLQEGSFAHAGQFVRGLQRGDPEHGGSPVLVDEHSGYPEFLGYFPSEAAAVQVAKRVTSKASMVTIVLADGREHLEVGTKVLPNPEEAP